VGTIKTAQKACSIAVLLESKKGPHSMTSPETRSGKCATSNTQLEASPGPVLFSMFPEALPGALMPYCSWGPCAEPGAREGLSTLPETVSLLSFPFETAPALLMGTIWTVI
jgi:hypothetical protein